MTQTIFPIAVSGEEVGEFGCPYCGYHSGICHISSGDTSVFTCGECERRFAVLSQGVTVSSIGLGEYYPKLIKHPRHGVPKHGRTDLRPEKGGEFFKSRSGLGLDITPGCFICGGNQRLYHNIAAFVRTKEAGERVVAMFQHGAWLDYREHEPDWIQVKIGACATHKSNLENLDSMTLAEGIIMPEMIQEATRS